MEILTARGHRFQERHPAGQDLRTKPGKWERATNAQQKRLVRAYDSWSASTRRLLAVGAARGLTEVNLQILLDAELVKLEATLADLTAKGVTSAGRLVAGRTPGAGVASLIAKEVEENRRMVSEALIPTIKNRLRESLARGVALDSKALRGAFLATRSMPAQYAGGYWVMIFKTHQEMGKEKDIEALRMGEAVEPVRWVLDRLAEHCEESPGYHGCPSLAGEYPGGWGSLPTVPAGQVTCRGNCRCSLEIFQGGKWIRP